MPLYPRLFENPDRIFTDDERILLWYTIDAYAFGYFEGKFYVGENKIIHENMPVLKDGKLITIKREEFLYAGRIWINHKYITFWDYPDKDQMNKVLHDLEVKLHINIIDDPSWKIELANNEEGEVIIKLQDYIGSPDQDSTETRHLLPPGAGKKEVFPGYGSKNPKYQSKRQWQIASLTDESYQPVLEGKKKSSQYQTVKNFIEALGFISEGDEDLTEVHKTWYKNHKTKKYHLRKISEMLNRNNISNELSINKAIFEESIYGQGYTIERSDIQDRAEYDILLIEHKNIHESLDEKFKEGTDSVRDILGYNVHDFKNVLPEDAFDIEITSDTIKWETGEKYKKSFAWEFNLSTKKLRCQVTEIQDRRLFNFFKSKFPKPINSPKDLKKAVDNYEKWWHLRENVNEKFEEESDPVEDMGIGTEKFILQSIKNIFLEDKKNKYLISFSGNIGSIKITATYFQIWFFDTEMYHYSKPPKLSGKYIKVDKLAYAKELIEKVGLSKCFYVNDAKYGYHTRIGIDFTIRPEYHKFFKPLKKEYFFDFFLNEKFEEDTDPIRDMGIGLYSNRNFETFDEMYKFVIEHTPAILNRKTIPRSIVGTYDGGQTYTMKPEFFKPIRNYVTTYCMIKGKPSPFGITAYAYNLMSLGYDSKIAQIKPKSLGRPTFEAFTEDSDPVEDMGIGIKRQIDEFIEENDSDEDVKNGRETPATYIVQVNDLENETKKTWIEYLLRTGKELLQKWDENTVEEMSNAGVEFIPNCKNFYDIKFRYDIKDGVYQLHVEDWSDFYDYFCENREVSHDFVQKILSGDADRFFNYHNDCNIHDVDTAMSTEEKKQFILYLKPYSSERDVLDGTESLVEVFETLPVSIRRKLINAYENMLAQAEEDAACTDIIRTIKRDLGITLVNTSDDNHLILNIKKEGLNKLFKAQWLKADFGIKYNPPQYGWSGDFNYEYFIEEMDNQLES